jgi:hypothetical protein
VRSGGFGLGFGVGSGLGFGSRGESGGWGGSGVLSVMSLGPEGVSGGGLPPGPSVGLDVELPAVAVGDAVVVAAQRDEPVQVGGAAEVVFVEVMSVAPGGRGGTAGEHTASVANRHGSALCGGGVTDGSSHVQRDTKVVDDDGNQVGVAQQHPNGPISESHPGRVMNPVGMLSVDDQAHIGARRTGAGQINTLALTADLGQRQGVSDGLCKCSSSTEVVIWR